MKQILPVHKDSKFTEQTLPLIYGKPETEGILKVNLKCGLKGSHVQRKKSKYSIGHAQTHVKF